MENSKNSFRKFVGYLNNEDQEGGYWLPNIQRPFVWREDQIERFFDSIMREYPVGTLLIWKTKSQIRRRKFIDNYKTGLKLSDYYEPENSKQKMLVLDGQQRLQSLFIGLKGSYDKRELCLDILSGDIGPPDDIKYKFKFLPKEEIIAPWFKLKDIVFSNKEYNKIVDSLIPQFDYELNSAQKDRVVTNISKIKRNFTEDNLAYQVVDSIDNDELYKEDDIVEIFIRANSGGTLLGKSDLLFSLLTASWDDADENMEELLEDLNRTGYKFNRDFILKTCLSLFRKGAAYNVEKFRDVSIRNDIETNWKAISEAIREVKDYIYGKTFLRTDQILPSYLTLIPLVFFRYHYKSKWGSANIRDYLLRTLLTKAFSGSPDSMIDKCTRKIDEMQDFDTNEILGVIRAEGRNLEITQDTVLGQSYGSKEIHILFNLWYPFNYEPVLNNNRPQVDHIFPQSALKKLKDENPNSGRKDLLRYKSDIRDQIGNCMLLTARENGRAEKTDKLPEEWFAGKDNEYLDLHLIPNDPELWKMENFERFVAERKKLIALKFDHLLIKNLATV